MSMELAHLVNPSDWEVNGNCSVAILPIYLYLVSVESGLVCCHLMIQYTCVVKIVKKTTLIIAIHFCFVNAQHLQVPLVWMSLNHLVTLSWWQVLLCLWLYWCLQLSALLSWLSGGGRSLTLMSILMLLLYTHSINCVEVEPLFRKHGNMIALEL